MRSNSNYLGLTAVFYTDCLFKPRAGRDDTFLWSHMPDNEKFIFTGILWSLLQRFDHKILELVLITQDEILTVNGSIDLIKSRW